MWLFSSAHRLLASAPETGQMHHKLRWYTLGKAAAPAKCECSATSTWDKKSGSALSAHAVICNSWLHRQTVCLSVKRISLKPNITWKWQETEARKLENEPTCLGSFKVLIKNVPFPCREPPPQRTSKELFRKKGKRGWGRQKWGETQRDINKQIVHPSCLSSSSALSLPVIVTQMEQLVARKRGESVLMFVLFCSGLFWGFFWGGIEEINWTGI